MAIPGYYGRWLLKHHFKNVLSKSRFRGFSMSIDMNSVIHTVSGRVFSDSSLSNLTDTERELRCFEMIGEYLLRILSLIKITDLLIIAVDGLAPMGKIKQQKQRRYISAKKIDPKAVFDSNCISPGTEFMFRLDSFLERWLNDSEIRPMLPKKVIYSGHMDPGEGEHKIFTYFRTFSVAEESRIRFKPGDLHYVHGMDADLIMLSMLSPVKNIVLIRTDVDELINIDALRTAISGMMSPVYIVPKNSVVQKHYFIEDFVILMCFFGNDFLPKLLMSGSSFDRLDSFIEVYKKLKKPIFDGISINESNFKLLVEKLLPLEEKFLEENSKERGKGKFNLEKFKEKCYASELKFLNLEYLPESLQKEFKNGNMNQEEVQNMAKEYVKGIYWVLRYYLTGTSDLEWFYKYHRAPMLSEISLEIKNYIIDQNLVYSFSPLEQLLIIIPEKSKNCLPRFLRSAYDLVSPIKDQMPEDFKVIDKHIAVIGYPVLSEIKDYINSLDLGADLKQSYSPKMALLVNNENYLKVHQEQQELRKYLKGQIQKSKSRTLKA